MGSSNSYNTRQNIYYSVHCFMFHLNDLHVYLSCSNVKSQAREGRTTNLSPPSMLVLRSELLNYQIILILWGMNVMLSERTTKECEYQISPDSSYMVIIFDLEQAPQVFIFSLLFHKYLVFYETTRLENPCQYAYDLIPILQHVTNI